MMKNVVNSVLISENNTVRGIVDQKDILEKVLIGRKDPEKTKASEIMSTPVLAIDSDESLVEALKTIRVKRIPRLAVMKNGKLIAMLT
jgi:CBS domain-containing protein